MKLTFRENGVACLRDIKHNEIIWRNFEGRKEQFNTEGKRKFTLSLPDEIADQLTEAGFNVKIRVPKTTGTNNAEEVRPYKNLEVNLKYYGGQHDPKVYLMLNNGDYQLLDEETVKLVDHMSINACDMDIYPKHYINSFTGQDAISARLNNMRVVQNVDDFANEFGIER